MTHVGSFVVALGILGVELGLAACDGTSPAPSKEPTTTSSASAAPRPASAPEDPLARLSVDELGPFLRDQRIDLAAQDGMARLQAAIGRLPVSGRSVPLTCERNAKVQDVQAVVNALGDAGAIEVEVKTPGRDGKVEGLKVAPEPALQSGLPDCSVVAMVKKDGTTAVWHARGGTATKLRKGLAGPDLSMTVEALAEQSKSCSSPAWLLSGENGVLWGLVSDLAARAKSLTPPLHTTQVGLPRDTPIAGRPLHLTTGKSRAP